MGSLHVCCRVGSDRSWCLEYCSGVAHQPSGGDVIRFLWIEWTGQNATRGYWYGSRHVAFHGNQQISTHRRCPTWHSTEWVEQSMEADLIERISACLLLTIKRTKKRDGAGRRAWGIGFSEYFSVQSPLEQALLLYPQSSPYSPPVCMLFLMAQRPFICRRHSKRILIAIRGNSSVWSCRTGTDSEKTHINENLTINARQQRCHWIQADCSRAKVEGAKRQKNNCWADRPTGGQTVNGEPEACLMHAV